MSSEPDIAGFASEIASFIAEQGVRFDRGEPLRYFSHISRISLGLTLPMIAPHDVARVIAIKNLCTLWNIIVDDEIDRLRTRHNLDSSMRMVLAQASGSPLVDPGSEAARTLGRMFALLPGDREQEREALYFDLLELMNGFGYEYNINRLPKLASSVDYCRYSTMTASIKTHLDIDWMFASAPLPRESYAKLRAAYDHLSMAIKFSSDIGTLRREILEEENLNLVRIMAAESGIIDLSVKISEERYGIETDAMRGVVAEIARMASTNLASARSILSGLVEVDARPIIETVEAIVRPYLAGQDPFFAAKPRVAQE